MFKCDPNKCSFVVDKDTFDRNYFVYDEKYLDQTDKLRDLRKASIIHKIIRENVRKILHNGVKFTDIIETSNKMLELLRKNNINIGYAFPIGISVNEVAVHDSVFSMNDERTLHSNDVVKIDIGIHVNGNIIDSAFTTIIDDDISNHPLYPVIEATSDATFSCIALCGVDVRIKELSECIKEVIESYEINGEKLHAIEGLGGHNILPHQVHGGKLILSVPDDIQDNQIMEEDEIYAIETFSSTGYGKVTQVLDDKLCPMTHFVMNRDILKHKVNKTLKNEFMNWVINERKGMPFSPLWCNHIKNYVKEINERVMNGDIIAYPALTDKIGSYTGQTEHTIHIKHGGVEILSLGNDY
jgi:methionyl aminopeptidase